MLTLIMNICLKENIIPDAWKKSTTILIPKCTEPKIARDYRPIALTPTVYRLFAGLLTRRLSAWFEEGDILTPSQKGFMPHDGVFENNFVLQQRVQKVRKSGGEVCIFSSDLANAFGSVPHEVLLYPLRMMGAGDRFTELIGDIYTENFTSFVTAERNSDPVLLQEGVKQGCPLSGLLFNITMNNVLRAVPQAFEKHNILSYADDVLLLADSPEELQEHIDIFALGIQKIGLRINPSKCSVNAPRSKTPEDAELPPSM